MVLYIGGGFGVGIHNILEAAVYGIPVIFGPNYKKFQEAVDLIELEGAFSIADYTGFSRLMSDLLVDNSSLYASSAAISNDYSQRNRGATIKVLDIILKQQ